jgi:diacylglycerol kinase
MRLLELFSSLRHAGAGLATLWRQEPNVRYQTAIALVVVGVGFWVHLRLREWIVIVLLIGAVLVLECVNSVLERLANGLSPRVRPWVRDAKDMMAGAVLLTSLLAAIAGTLIFWPYLVY